MIIEALAGPAVKAQATNSTDASFPSSLATVTKPAVSATRAVFDMGQGTNRTTIRVTPYGVGANNQTMNVMVMGWNQVLVPGTTGGSTSTATKALWVSRHICEVQGTVSSTLVGVAGTDITATSLFCDVLTLTTGVAVLYQGTADADTASFIADCSTFELVEVMFKLGTVATSMNALVQFS